MKFLALKTKMATMPFFSPLQMKMVLDNHVPKTVTTWQKKNYLKKLRNNLYMVERRPEDMDENLLFLLANQLYAPSYVSLQTAFSFYGLIPEAVYTISSCTTKKKSYIETPLGSFSYRKVKENLFFGYNIVPAANACFRIADLEKSILDYLYLHPKAHEVAAFGAMRWNKEVLQKLNQKKIELYLRMYNVKALNKRVAALKKYYG